VQCMPPTSRVIFFVVSVTEIPPWLRLLQRCREERWTNSTRIVGNIFHRVYQRDQIPYIGSFRYRKDSRSMLSGGFPCKERRGALWYTLLQGREKARKLLSV
jgi:hypothetical protein